MKVLLDHRKQIVFFFLKRCESTYMVAKVDSLLFYRILPNPEFQNRQFVKLKLHQGHVRTSVPSSWY